MGVLEKFSLKNKKALITGGGSGIGEIIAKAFSEAGADVAIVDINFKAAKKCADYLKIIGIDSFAIKTDVNRQSEVKKMVNSVIKRWGRLDIAVNSAGIGIQSPAEDITEISWDKVLNLNLKGVYLSTKEEGKIMLKQGNGSIINIASMSGQITNRPQLHAHYNASKAGVIQYSRSCAAEWANRGVRVNTISPGHTITPMTKESIPNMSPIWIGNTPMARLATPED